MTQFEARSGDSADVQIFVEQEGSYVLVSLQKNEKERADVLLTPDLAESMISSLEQAAAQARAFSKTAAHA